MPSTKMQLSNTFDCIFHKNLLVIFISSQIHKKQMTRDQNYQGFQIQSIKNFSNLNLINNHQIL
ncbi:putative uncharacterized protein [Parachlamydia acanthamoebae UV-7]|uniref:Uncharacterized protein n=1 Tax=Parachlamydia acanthamoebae (strain UV7) TaxID=765952 RepID=F8KVR2_PARAV|nr:hypothetical protein pah_c014o115 [Parachlamydia acanthamoebae str. Hall's coccus]CCB85198.1 putative uncharacterized protein [Parachlamydia acanthamoebae UV-7]